MDKEDIQKDSFFNKIKRIFSPGFLVNREVKINRSGWFYMGLTLLVGFSAINTGNNLQYLLLGIMLSILIASFWLSESMLVDFQLKRKLPDAVCSEEEFQIIYEIKNLKRFLPLVGLKVKELIEDKEFECFFMIVRNRGEEFKSIRASIKKRGRAKFKRLVVATNFPFGFFMKAKKINLEQELVVFPKPLAQNPEHYFSNPSSGEINFPERGIGGEHFGFREYLYGDPIKLIHWKTSAKRGEELVRETEREIEKAISIELDLPFFKPVQDSPERENLISRTAGLCKYYIEQGYSVRLRIKERGIDYGSGPGHLERILYFLALFDDPEKPDKGEELGVEPFLSQRVFLA